MANESYPEIYGLLEEESLYKVLEPQHFALQEIIVIWHQLLVSILVVLQIFASRKDVLGNTQVQLMVGDFFSLLLAHIKDNIVAQLLNCFTRIPCLVSPHTPMICIPTTYLTYIRAFLLYWWKK